MKKNLGNHTISLSGNPVAIDLGTLTLNTEIIQSFYFKVNGKFIDDWKLKYNKGKSKNIIKLAPKVKKNYENTLKPLSLDKYSVKNFRLKIVPRTHGQFVEEFIVSSNSQKCLLRIKGEVTPYYVFKSNLKALGNPVKPHEIRINRLKKYIEVIYHDSITSYLAGNPRKSIIHFNKVQDVELEPATKSLLQFVTPGYHILIQSFKQSFKLEYFTKNDAKQIEEILKKVISQ